MIPLERVTFPSSSFKPADVPVPLVNSDRPTHRHRGASGGVRAGREDGLLRIHPGDWCSGAVRDGVPVRGCGVPRSVRSVTRQTRTGCRAVQVPVTGGRLCRDDGTQDECGSQGRDDGVFIESIVHWDFVLRFGIEGWL